MQCLADVRVDLYISLIDFRLFVLLSKGLLESLRSYQSYVLARCCPCNENCGLITTECKRAHAISICFLLALERARLFIKLYHHKDLPFI
ncbi:hypothetical protein OIU76_009288 [Salix suchowensis]|nr:hypothetical protein OIU76_009288 [Salix suchowensis]